jgi:hypothetical protein
MGEAIKPNTLKFKKQILETLYSVGHKKDSPNFVANILGRNKKNYQTLQA